MRGAGFEPDVENIGFFSPLRGAARTLRPRRKKFFGGMRVPGVGAFAFEKRQHVAQGVKIAELLAAGIAVKNDQRNAPETLARNAPVGAVGDHVVHAIAAPRRNPFHFLDFREGLLAQVFLIESDEPLLGGAEDHRIVAAPAVRIAVLELAFGDERPARLQQLNDDADSPRKRSCPCIRASLRRSGRRRRAVRRLRGHIFGRCGNRRRRGRERCERCRCPASSVT